MKSMMHLIYADCCNVVDSVQSKWHPGICLPC